MAGVLPTWPAHRPACRQAGFVVPACYGQAPKASSFQLHPPKSHVRRTAAALPDVRPSSPAPATAGGPRAWLRGLWCEGCAARAVAPRLMRGLCQLLRGLWLRGLWWRLLPHLVVAAAAAAQQRDTSRGAKAAAPHSRQPPTPDDDVVALGRLLLPRPGVLGRLFLGPKDRPLYDARITDGQPLRHPPPCSPPPPSPPPPSPPPSAILPPSPPPTTVLLPSAVLPPLIIDGQPLRRRPLLLANPPPSSPPLPTALPSATLPSILPSAVRHPATLTSAIHRPAPLRHPQPSQKTLLPRTEGPTALRRPDH